MHSRLPKLIFVLLLLYAAVYFSSVYLQLPEVVVSHFDARGRPNGWQTKSAFFSMLFVVSLLISLVSLGIPRIITALPMQLINLPNKDYWLAPEHREETIAFLNAYFAWFGCALFLTIILTFDYAIQINLRPENAPSPARFWYILSGFLAFTIVSTIRMLAKFLRPPDATPRS